MNRGALNVLVLTLCVVALAGPAEAAIVTFYGADHDVGPDDPRPIAGAAAASFDAAAGTFGLIDFEGLTVGDFAAMVVAPGVAVTLTNTASDTNAGISNADQHDPFPLGYNTTSGGFQHLRVVPFPNSAGGTVTFSFASPIDAFGFYLTDTQDIYPGPITLTFNDGSSWVLGITKNDDTGGTLFFGFTDFDTTILSVAFHTGATISTRDIWGIDDVRFRQVPEPGPAALLLAGGALLLARRLRSHRP